MTELALSAALQHGMQSLGISVSSEQSDKLLEYLELLVCWNSSYNLTAVREPMEMVHRHLLDSLAIAALLPATAQRLIDVGTGAGLPGVPLAVLYPERQFDLLDSNGKKTRFLFQVKTALGLDNMAVRHARVEAWVPEQRYDVVLSRAFASLSDMVKGCAHLCGENASLLAMKGQRPEAELADLPAWVQVREIHELEVPGVDEARHLVDLQLATRPQQQGLTGKISG
ncbi:MAG: 16S rRNA (guanine(527)-N(7))-methyltransferase RsmG [Halieaceae bacterium]